jgi:cobalt-zinc-cadmium resistance protein CzcA
MIDKIIYFSVKNKLVISIFTGLLAIWGIYSLGQLPIDALPDITNNQVQVISIVPSLSAPDCERLITFPIEQAMATVPEVEEIRSFSRFGLSVVTIVFKESTDIYWARQQIAERLVSVRSEIPTGVGEPQMAPLTTGLGEIYQYYIKVLPGYENQYDINNLRTIQDWVVRRQLLGTKGVADVSSFGGEKKQYEIALNLNSLKSLNININEVFSALEMNNQNTGGAYIEKNPYTYYIRSEGLIGSINDIENVVVKSTVGGTPILMRNIATVKIGAATRYGAMTLNDKTETVGAIVMMLKGENSFNVIENVKSKIEEISKTLPKGIEIVPFLDRTKLVNSAIATVAKNLAEGALIVIFILILMLGNLRAGMIVASVIPLSMLFALTMMNLFGVSGNLMSLGAIDFGLIVNGAVIIVETALHHFAVTKHVGTRTQGEIDNEVYGSTKKIMTFLAFGETIILIVYLPILALVGIEGKMFRPMAQTVAFAILGAFIFSLTYVPMVTAMFLGKKEIKPGNFSDKLMDFFQKLFHPTLKYAIKFKVAVIPATFVLFFISVYIFMNMGGEFIPTLDEGDFAVETRVLPGSSLNYTVETMKKASRVLKDNFPEVKDIVGKIGTSEIPTDPMPVEAGDMIIVLKPHSDWTSAETRDELANKMSEKLKEEIPEATFGFQQPIQMRFNELITGAKQDLVIKIYGEDLDTLSSYAEKMGSIAKTIKGAEDIYIEKVTGSEQIVVRYDRARIAQYGLSIDEINKAVGAGFAGAKAGLVFEGEKRFDLVVRMNDVERATIDDLKKLLIVNKEGLQIPLEQVANVSYELGPSQIQRDDTKRRITVGLNVRGGDVETIVKELMIKVNNEMKLLPGYSIKYGGAYKNLNEAKDRLKVALPIALFLIFVLLYFTFQSIKQGLLIFSAIPLSAIGGVLALWSRGMPFSISGGIGFIALFGVAVLNGIVLIGEFNRLKKSGLHDLNEIVLRGTALRLRPVLMTALVASLGFLPMAISNEAGAEVQKPLATVVIGGLISATLLTLIVLPILYIYSEKIKFDKKKTKDLVVTGFLFFALFTQLSAQENTNLSLDETINIAIKNHPKLKVNTLEGDYEKIMKKTANELNKTFVAYGFGNINSESNDIRISLQQTVPLSMGSQTQVFESNYNLSVAKGMLLKSELVYQTKVLYSEMILRKKTRDLYLSQDSIYSYMYEASVKRSDAGDINKIELLSIQAQKSEMSNLLKESEISYESAKLSLINFIGLNDKNINFRDANFIEDFNINGKDLNKSAFSNYQKQNIEVANSKVNYEKAKLYPDLSFGYALQSFNNLIDANGVKLDNKLYGNYEVGIAVPLWYGPTFARIDAAEINTEIAKQNYNAEMQIRNNLLIQAKNDFKKSKQNFEFYKVQNETNTKVLSELSSKAYIVGEINYMQLQFAMSNALKMQEGYLKSGNALSQSVYYLEYLLGE